MMSPEPTATEIQAWLEANPGWFTTRHMHNVMTNRKGSFHRFRRKVQTLKDKGLILHRIKHETAQTTEGRYNNPVYEYRRKLNLDT